MPTLYEEIASTLPKGMSIPDPLKLLFGWIEENGYITEERVRKRGKIRVGHLYPFEKLRAESTESESVGGTQIRFSARGNESVVYWLRNDTPEIIDRLYVFAKTGADGSMAAFWLDDDGKQPIVHLGSGSGSTLVCVLADTPIEFLRLLAIGYEEICWSQLFKEPPNSRHMEGQAFVHPNVAYQDWIRKTFAVTIPKTAAEIVRNISLMGDKDSADPFWNWSKNVPEVPLERKPAR